VVKQSSKLQPSRGKCNGQISSTIMACSVQGFAIYFAHPPSDIGFGISVASATMIVPEPSKK
jgi:hypothetical protein